MTWLLLLAIAATAIELWPHYRDRHILALPIDLLGAVLFTIIASFLLHGFAGR